MAIIHYTPFPSVVFVVVAAALMCFFPCTLVDAATTYKVGGKAGWDGLETTGPEYEDWVLSRTFYVGDTIRFEYDPRLNNVVEVGLKDFILCDQPSIPFAVYASGNDSITFTEEGCYYYITRRSTRCFNGQKVAFSVHSRGGGQGPADPAASFFSCYPSESLRSRTYQHELESRFFHLLYVFLYLAVIANILYWGGMIIMSFQEIDEGTPNPPESSCCPCLGALKADTSVPDSEQRRITSPLLNGSFES